MSSKFFITGNAKWLFPNTELTRPELFWLQQKTWIFIKSNSKDIEYDLVYCTLWTIFHFYLPQCTNAVWSNFKCACSVAWKATAQVQQKATTNEKPHNQKSSMNRQCFVLQGMGYLHAKGIVHKDLKSKNVFHDTNKVVITDFGLFGISGVVQEGR